MFATVAIRAVAAFRHWHAQGIDGVLKVVFAAFALCGCMKSGVVRYEFALLRYAFGTSSSVVQFANIVHDIAGIARLFAV